MITRLRISCAVALVALLSSASPAVADDGDIIYKAPEATLPTTSTTSSTTSTTMGPPDLSITSDVNATPQQLADRYTSLASALVAYQAQRSGETLSTYVTKHTAQLSDLFGTDVSNLGLAQLPSDDITAFNKKLSEVSAVARSSQYKSLDDMVAALSTNSGGPDAAVTTQAVKWVNQIAAANASAKGLRSTALSLPSVSAPSTSILKGSPQESLAFGLFANRSANAMIQNFPDVFATVMASGTLSTEALGAFQKSMEIAAQATQADLSNGLISKCQAALIASAAGTNIPGAGGAGCGACVAAGTYLRPQMGQLLNPKSGALLSDSSDGQLSVQEWNTLTDHQRKSLLEKYPTLKDELKAREQQAAAQPKAAADCQAASAIEQGAAGSALSGVFSRLGQ